MSTTPKSQQPGSEPTDSSAAALPLWPTPSACNANDGEGARTWLARREKLKAQKMNGNAAGMPLAIAVQVPVERARTSAAVLAPSTSSMAGHPVNPLAARVSALVREIAGGAGESSYVSLATWHRNGYWQRAQPALFPCDTQEGSRPLDEYSQSWPRWGIVAPGASGVPLMSALHTDGTECSSSGDSAMNWPTPQAADSAQGAVVGATEEYRTLPSGRLRKYTQNGKDGSPSLGHLATLADREGMWPTPTSAGEKLAARPTPGMAHRPGRVPGNLLETVARALWPTPTGPNGGRSPQGGMGPTGMTPEGIERQVDLGHHVKPQARRVYEATAWPSLRASDGTKGGPNQAGSKGDLMLPSAAAQAQGENWATPCASCHDMDTLERSRYSRSRLKEMKQAGQPYQTKTSGMLSARWVCLLMALPPTYLDIPPLPGRAGRRVRAVPKKPLSPPD